MTEESVVKDVGDGDPPKIGDVDPPKIADGDPESSSISVETPVEAPASSSDPSPAVETVSITPEETARKRRASSAFSEPDAIEDFRGFDTGIQDESSNDYSRIIERIQTEISTDSVNLTPLRTVTVTSTPARVNKKIRRDTGTDVSRPSSGLSWKSDGESSSDPVVPKHKDVPPRMTLTVKALNANKGYHKSSSSEMSSPLLRVPLERGWKRELVFRASLDVHTKRNADIYYYTPQGKKLRSSREISEHLSGTGLTLENFSFFKEPLGVNDPEKEIIRDAKLLNRHVSPAASPKPIQVEGKRTPKPKAPKGSSPVYEKTVISPPAKIRVKSFGSRLANNNTPPQKKTTVVVKPKNQTPTANENNNTAWKKPSDKAKTRISNGPSVTGSPRRKGRQKGDDVDHFTPFYNTCEKNNYNGHVQIFQYLGMRDLARCARVCKAWRKLADNPSLWRHVRMKNSQVSDWQGLCKSLQRHGTCHLDLRKMLIPEDVECWKSFTQHISKADCLERVELCRCPASAVEALASKVPKLRSLSALSIRDTCLNPEPISNLTQLQELRLKSLSGLTLTKNLSSFTRLSKLKHLSLTSIKDLGCSSCEVVGELGELVSLELGECTFGSSFGNVLSNLKKLQRLRLERVTSECASPALIRSLAKLPKLEHLELVNFDVKIGFDDALSQCKNIQRLLIIPTYVSQSATTNKQVLSGVLSLKQSLSHLMWGVTIELLRVTELFIDQCDQNVDTKKKDVGECIPVLKPVPGCKLPEEHQPVAGPPQVEILPLSTLQRLLSAQLPSTKLKLLRIPFHATWRQSLADFQ